MEADPKRSKIDLGIHVGLNPSTTSVTGSGLEYGTRTGLVAGVETDLRVNYYLSLELGLLYSQKGASVNFASGSTSSTFKYQWNYLELPLLVKANFSTGNFSPFAVAGPYGALLLSAHTNTTASDGTSSETNSDTKGQMKKFDYGIYAGLGADFKLNNRFSLTSQTRFGLGLANVTTVGEMTRIRNVEILIGLKLAIK